MSLSRYHNCSFICSITKHYNKYHNISIAIIGETLFKHDIYLRSIGIANGRSRIETNPRSLSGVREQTRSMHICTSRSRRLLSKISMISRMSDSFIADIGGDKTGEGGLGISTIPSACAAATSRRACKRSRTFQMDREYLFHPCEWF